ncbi:Ribbon-helix-helix protein, copG family [Geoglobus ahangari]|uniref:Ribbon-helix-helix protein, copG family n=1 Tax=Geoglobus ahangari TaxID=113653 RepID=A0A0F7IFN9_9EURY|nr:ribbon-helix-helix domain-containing protein [Geoglobus ahangari]AKG91679.1 Ribbon-helix-helix protein, copG family [Geoglobus ahangari]
MRIVNLRLDERIVERIDEISSKLLISRSEVIRQALTLYISLIENIGFYFKPSVFSPKLDIYEERNGIYVDLGNNLSLSVFNIVYGGIGEKEGDWLKAGVERVAEIMAYQIEVESICRFIQPLAVELSTGNELDYGMRFYRRFRELFSGRVVFADSEDVAKTDQSFFSAVVVGVRDMRVKNIPKRGEKIFLYGRVMRGEELLRDNPPDLSVFRRLAEMVKEGKASSIMPVKGDGIRNACIYAASIAGGRLRMRAEIDGGCPATAVIVSAEEMPLEGGVEVGEIL